MPRLRPRLRRSARHWQARATSSGPRIQPEPSQTPCGQAASRKGSLRAIAIRVLPPPSRPSEVGPRGAGVGERRLLAGGLLDRLLLAGEVGELREAVEEDQLAGPDRAVAVLGDDQVGEAVRLLVGVAVVVLA